jgi:hypothetical protein
MLIFLSTGWGKVQNTQEIDLHNGARLPAELLETMGDKLTMQIQEIMAQALTKDDRSKILQIMNEAIREAALTVWHEYNEKFQEDIRNNYQSLIDFLIEFIELKFGPLSGSFPLVHRKRRISYNRSQRLFSRCIRREYGKRKNIQRITECGPAFRRGLLSG